MIVIMDNLFQKTFSFSNKVKTPTEARQLGGKFCTAGKTCPRIKRKAAGVCTKPEGYEAHVGCCAGVQVSMVRLSHQMQGKYMIIFGNVSKKNKKKTIRTHKILLKKGGPCLVWFVYSGQ